MLDDASLHHKPQRTQFVGGEFEILGIQQEQFTNESHSALSQLSNFLANHGLRSEFRNPRNGRRKIDLPAEMNRAREWWKNHGDNFLAGKVVPNPQLSNPWIFMDH
jgi:hypothetical protein